MSSRLFLRVDIFNKRSFSVNALFCRQLLLLCILFFSPSKLANSIVRAPFLDGMKLLESFLKNTQSAQGKFKQIYIKKRINILDGKRQINEKDVVMSGESVSKDVMHGHFQFLRPDRFIWVYESPYRQKLQSDGQALFLYDQDLDQVTKRLLKSIVEINPVAILFGKSRCLADLKPKYKISNFTNDAELSASDLSWVKLESKIENSEFPLIYIGFVYDDCVKLSRIKLDDAFGNVLELHFFNLEQNVKISEHVFHFSIPSGVDVIEE